MPSFEEIKMGGCVGYIGILSIDHWALAQIIITCRSSIIIKFGLPYVVHKQNYILISKSICFIVYHRACKI